MAQNSIYNSKKNIDDNESDITIINASIINENSTNDSQRNLFPETNGRSSGNLSFSQKNDEHSDFIYVEQDRFKIAQDLESILQHYVQDLKEQDRTHFYCSGQLIIRIMDLIRPAYANDKNKMSSVEKLLDDINSLHDKRCIDEKEQIELLHQRIQQLNAQMVDLEDRNGSIVNNLQSFVQLDSIGDPTQLTEMEDDTRKLQEIIEKQKNSIEQISELIRNCSLEVAKTNSNPPQESRLRQRFDQVVNAPEKTPSPEPNQERDPLLNHSPGTSPTQSFSTLTQDALKWVSGQEESGQQAGPQQTDQFEDAREPELDLQPEPEREPETGPARVPADMEVLELSPEEGECPLCSEKFPMKSSPDVPSLYDHIELCLGSSGPPAQPKKKEDFICPVCDKKFLHENEEDYRKHLGQCFGDDRF